jgi:hypothetical protein
MQKQKRKVMFAKVEVYQCFGEKTDGVTEKKSNVKVRH